MLDPDSCLPRELLQSLVLEHTASRQVVRPLGIQKHDRYWLIGRRTGTKQAPQKQQNGRKSGNLYPSRPTRQNKIDLAVRYLHILQFQLDRWHAFPFTTSRHRRSSPEE